MIVLLYYTPSRIFAKAKAYILQGFKSSRNYEKTTNNKYALARCKYPVNPCPGHPLSPKTDCQFALLGILWQYFSTLSRRCWSSDGVFFLVPEYPFYSLLIRSNLWLVGTEHKPSLQLVIYLQMRLAISFHAPLPALPSLPKPCQKHLLANDIAAAGVGRDTHKPRKLVLDPQYVAEMRGWSEHFFMLNILQHPL